MDDLIELALMQMTTAWPTDDDGKLLRCLLCDKAPAGDAITTGWGAVHADHDDRDTVARLAESQFAGDVEVWTLGPLTLGWVQPEGHRLWVGRPQGGREAEGQADVLPALLQMWEVAA